MQTTISLDVGAPEFQALNQKVQRGIRLAERLSRIPFAEEDAIREAWCELTGTSVDASFSLVPPVYTDHGLNIRVGRNVFINHGCTLMDIGGIELGDDVMLGPGVRLITSAHPLDPAERRRWIVAAPITIGRNVWIGAGATVLHGVTVGEGSVVAAGAVVTSDLPAGVLAAGVPARVVKSVGADRSARGSSAVP